MVLEWVRWLRGRAGRREVACPEPLTPDRYAGQVLQALERASEVMREGQTQDEMFRVVGATLAQFGLRTAILLLDDSRESLAISFLNNEAKTIRRAEFLVGATQKHFRLRVQQSSLARQVLGEERTVYVPDATTAMAELFPNVPVTALKAVSRVLGFRSILGAPLVDGPDPVGMMVVSAGDLSAGDQQVVRLFAAQLSANMRTLRILDELQHSLGHLENTRNQLLESQKRETIGLLAGGVAHDFNNMLSAISMSSEHIGSEVDSTAVADDLRIIHDACARGSSLVKQLLALGRRADLQISAVDVDAMLSDLLGLLQRVLGEDVHVGLDFGGGDKVVEVDRSQLEQVLVNLALNARDAMPKGGELTLRTSRVELTDAVAPLRSGSHVEIRVADDGQGMTAAIQAQAFEPFFTTKGRARGTGLGLSVVRSIVEQHHGSIEVASTPGRGTSVRILLPVTAARPTAPPHTPPRVAVVGSGELVLVIEDDALIARSCARALERAGWRVVVAADGAAARAAVEEQQADIAMVFCDVVLPDTRGPKLLQSLIPRIPEAAIVVTSGYVGERSDEALIERNGWEFLPKPYTRRELVEVVHRVIDAR